MKSFLHVAVIIIAAGAFVYWLSISPGPVEMRVPIPENDPALMPTPEEKDVNKGTLTSGTGKPSTLDGSWPQFRGEDRDNVVPDVSIAATRPEFDPEILWSLEVGEGHAGAAIHNGCVYFIDYDEEAKEDVIRSLSFDDGEEIWRYSYYVKIKRNHGMSRTVPAVTDDYVVTLGPKCHVHCLRAASGELVWKKDLVREYGAKVPEWYAGQCPLIDRGRAILAPGGSALLVAIDLATGETVGRTPNPEGWEMTHASILPITFDGQRQYIVTMTGGAAGIDGETWEVLWTLPEWKMRIATVASPVDLGNGKVFFARGYNAGSLMLQLKREAGAVEPEILFTTDAQTYGSDQQTPIHLNGHIYGVIPGGKLACLSEKGEQRWVEESYDFGLGPYLMFDGGMLVLDDNPVVLHLLDVSPEGAEPLASHRIIEGHEAWAPMAYANGRIVLRDASRLACVRVSLE